MLKVNVKVLATLIGVAILLLQGCTSSPSGSDRYKYTAHTVQVVNETTYEISDFHLEMIGSEDCIDVKCISKGDDTYRLVFSIPVLEGENPISWGDYHGYYTQNGFVQDIIIFNFEHEFCKEIAIKIQGESYKVSFSDK